MSKLLTFLAIDMANDQGCQEGNHAAVDVLLFYILASVYCWNILLFKTHEVNIKKC